MGTYVLAMQGARALATMISLTMLKQNDSVPAF